jgi:hypothetical protein
MIQITTNHNSGQENTEGVNQEGDIRGLEGIEDVKELFNLASNNKEELPTVLKRQYDENGRLVGIAILIQQGTIPVTGQQLAQLLSPQSQEQP